MNSAAREAARSADIIVFVTDVPQRLPATGPVGPDDGRNQRHDKVRPENLALASSAAHEDSDEGEAEDDDESVDEAETEDTDAEDTGTEDTDETDEIDAANTQASASPAGAHARRPRVPRGSRYRIVHPGDVTLLSDLPPGVPVLLVLNKVDRAHDKAALLPILDAYSKLYNFASIVPISARRTDGVTRVLDEVAKLCPEGAWRFSEDDITDKPTRFFASEYVREQILRATEAEVPHAAAVSIDGYVETPNGGVVHIDATIHVERPGQKKILIGRGAEMLKNIGTQARMRIQELVGRQVNLKLWVRVTPAWRQSSAKLEELGYTKADRSGNEGEGAPE